MMGERNEKITLSKELLDALALYLKDEAIKFYASKESKAFYEEYLKANIVKDVNDTNDNLTKWLNN